MIRYVETSSLNEASRPSAFMAQTRNMKSSWTSVQWLSATSICLAALFVSQSLLAWGQSPSLLPDGREFPSWAASTEFTKTYYVDAGNPQAKDSNAGTKERPFLTINRAAQLLHPGERVVIMGGVYRERVAPARGGTGPDKIISYEAAPGARVIVKGSRLARNGWELSTGYTLVPGKTVPPKARIYQKRLSDIDFQGYNPFGMVNVMQDRVYLFPRPDELKPHLLKRGMVFVDGRRLEQVELYRQLAQKDGTFWCEQDGLAIHLRLPGDADPAAHEMELVVQEQVFAPTIRGLNYVRIKGIHFEHAANVFPVPQRGLVSATRGHHWIVEDCEIQHANGVGLDIGYQDWNMEAPKMVGHSLVRRNHISDIGVCGIAGMGVQNTLIEDNVIEDVGWQDVEMTWETGGIKLHSTKNCLLQNNVIRHLVHAVGIWLDYENVNTRITSNVIGDTLSTLRGGIYLEASHESNMLDQNVIWKATEGKGGGIPNMTPHGGWGITVDGSDETVIAHNLIGLTQDAAIKFRTIESRIVGTRGGTSRWNQVLNNVFYHCGKGIDFPNPDNKAEGNLYSKDWGEVSDETQAVGRGLNWMSSPSPTLMLDLEAWRKIFGFDMKGAYADMNINVDLDALTLSWSIAGDIPQQPVGKHFHRDLLGNAAADLRKPGPLVDVPSQSTTISIDPRQAGK